MEEFLKVLFGSKLDRDGRVSSEPAEYVACSVIDFDKLVQAGWVDRKGDPTDKLSSMIPHAKKVFPAIHIRAGDAAPNDGQLWGLYDPSSGVLEKLNTGY